METQPVTIPRYFGPMPQPAARGRLRDRTERAADVDVMKRVGRAGIVLTSQEKKKRKCFPGK